MLLTELPIAGNQKSREIAMKSQQFLIIILIALGAITGSTFATISYLNDTQSLPNIENPVATPSATPDVAVKEPSEETPSPTPQAKSSDFSQFRLSLLDAVNRRDANFIRAIVTPETQWSFGGSVNLDTYNIDDAKSSFWQDMEKAVNAGCTVETNAEVAEKEADSDVWVCPETIGKAIYNFGWQEEVAILGQSVNVRSQASTSGAIVDVVSKQVIKFDTETFNSLSPELQESVNSADGWTPVLLENGKQGWIQNRFVYYEPRDFRVSFVLVKGEWRLRYFLKGDGN